MTSRRSYHGVPLESYHQDDRHGHAAHGSSLERSIPVDPSGARDRNDNNHYVNLIQREANQNLTDVADGPDGHRQLSKTLSDPLSGFMQNQDTTPALRKRLRGIIIADSLIKHLGAERVRVIEREAAKSSRRWGRSVRISSRDSDEQDEVEIHRESAVPSLAITRRPTLDKAAQEMGIIKQPSMREFAKSASLKRSKNL